MPKATILSVDDDEGLQTVVSHYLTTEGYNTLSAHSGAQLMEVLKSNSPHIILLDLVLPDTDGISILSELRREIKNTPVIVVSGKSDTTEKIICLEMGADDYMTKPFEMRELSARIKAVLRRSEEKAFTPANQPEPAGPSQVRFGEWVLDRLQFQLFNKDGVSADLTTGEYKLLDAMVSAQNKVMTRERLFELTRETDYDSFDRAVDIQVGRLRKKLGDDPKEPTYIKTVRGVGYMFCGEIKG